MKKNVNKQMYKALKKVVPTLIRETEKYKLEFENPEYGEVMTLEPLYEKTLVFTVTIPGQLPYGYAIGINPKKRAAFIKGSGFLVGDNFIGHQKESSFNCEVVKQLINVSLQFMKQNPETCQILPFVDKWSLFQKLYMMM